jgi:NADH-quinone oxidoreductase subunit E
VSFTPENLAEAQRIIGLYPKARSATLPLLHLAQNQDGWVSPEAMQEIAGLLDLSAAQVLGVCSFYTMFKRDQPKRLVVSVCTNVSCLVNGGPELCEALIERYEADDDVHVEEVECLAACDTAPVLQVNYEFHGSQNEESAATIIDEYRSGARVARGVSGGVVSGRAG